MFKKLKEKITEEVKISPQRFAEFTQSVTDRIQNSTSTDENFFSIAEDDANTSTNTNNQGYSSVSLVSPSQEDRPRRNSNVSIASDISFLPRYEPSNMYNLQSDLDISASEMEDNVSTASSQLGHLSKEQIHSAFQKSQMRYHKYRGRFTDLARHYKDLERENSKMKAILVETQDKAIRRVQELKEQCSLEQKAKAHLEGALRDEIDERNYKITSLETQISLLKNENSSDQSSLQETDNGNNTEKNETLMKYLNDARKEIDILNEKLQEMKANAIIFQAREQEYKLKIANFEKEVITVAEREKENNLKLAQNKMELHNEILMKDTEISNLKRENEILKQNLNAVDNDKKNTENMKLENLQSQNKKLIEKIESLSQKSTNLEKEVLKMEIYITEIGNLKKELEDLKSSNIQLTTEREILEKKLTESEEQYQQLSARYQEVDKSLVKEKKELEDQIENLRDEARKGLLSLEPKIREKLQNQFNQREIELKKEFENKIEELSSNNIGIKEIKLQLLLKDDIIKNMSEEIESLKSEISKKSVEYSSLETNHLDLIEDCNRLRNTINNLEKEKVTLEFYEEKIPRLEAHIKTLQEELQDAKKILDTKEYENIGLNSKIMELQDKLNTRVNETLDDHKKEIDKLKEISMECEGLKEKLELEQETNKQLCEAKFHLETELYQLGTEHSLVKQNLQSLEEELTKTAGSYELDREALIKDLVSIRNILTQADDRNTEPTETTFNHIIEDIKQLCAVKENEIIILKQNNTELSRNLSKMTEHCRLFEEKLKTIELENTESKILELTIQKLKEENDKLGQECEDERKKFMELLEIHTKLQEKEKLLEHLEEKLNKAVQGNIKLEEIISSLKSEILMLQEQKFHLKNSLTELQEKIHILEEKEESINLDKTECHLLEMKLQKLEEERRNLLDSFEMERVSFNKTYEHLAERDEKIKNLTEENVKTNHLMANCEQELENFKIILEEKDKLHEDTKLNNENKIKEYQEQIDKLTLSLNESNGSFENKMAELSHINDNLIKQLEEKDLEITKLAENISQLSQTIEKQCAEHASLQEKIEKLVSDSQKYQAEHIELLDEKSSCLNKIEELTEDIRAKTVELKDLNERLERADKYSDEVRIALSKKEELELSMGQLDNNLREKMDEINNITKENSMLIVENKKLQENLSKLETLLEGNETLQDQISSTKNETNNLKLKMEEIRSNYQIILQENQILSNAKEDLTLKVEETENSRLASESEKKAIIEQNEGLKNKIEDLNDRLRDIQQQNLELITQTKAQNCNGVDVISIQRDFYEIKEKFDNLFVENKSLKQEYVKLEAKCNEFGKTKEKMQNQISELEKQCTELLHEKQFLQDEIQELKILPLNYQNNSSTKLDQLEILKKEQSYSTNDGEKEAYQKEIECLRDKVTKYKSLDLTNKSSIEFYENELQKFKNQNDKLNRKLDETLVTLNHCAELSTSTEVEYLKNVLYNYMLGKESLVLARVIAAVCKFDPQQTDIILQREQQKQTLLGQLGFI